MARITAGISQIGGKFRLLKTVLQYIPYHEFYLEPFLGSAIILLNKPRCRYECGNDLNSEIINYLLTIREYPKEFDELKQGVFGLVSQEICNRIVRGELLPRNNIERAYFFYYLNKLTFGGSVQKGYGYMVDNHNLSREGYGRVDSKVVENAKQDYVYKTKGYKAMEDPSLLDVNKAKKDYEYITKGNMGLVNPRAIPQHTLHEKDFDDIKCNYKGVEGSYHQVRNTDVEKAKAQYTGILNNCTLGTLKEKQVNESKENYKKVSFRGVTPKSAQYAGIHNTRALGNSINSRDMDKWKKEANAAIKGINPKTTRPYTSNDCGLLSPLDPKTIKRLRYVNLTTYPFDKVYKMFYEAFHVRKGLGPECFIYFDPPYPSTEKYYGTGFGQEEHDKLITIIKESPFHMLLSIGGKCELYLEELKDMIIIPVKVKYSTDANSQTDKQEYLIMNYDINELPVMTYSVEQNTMEDWL